MAVGLIIVIPIALIKCSLVRDETHLSCVALIPNSELLLNQALGSNTKLSINRALPRKAAAKITSCRSAVVALVKSSA